MFTRTCLQCGKQFEVQYRSSRATHCSNECWQERRKGLKRKTRADKGVRKVAWITVECSACGKQFERPPGHVKRWEQLGWRSYCSDGCRETHAHERGRQPVPGTSYITEGYRYVYVPPEDRPEGSQKRPYYGEHRYAMSKILGRWPDAEETVHHINGDKLDNRPENLQLRTGRHGRGYILRCRCCGSQDIEHVEIE